MEKEMARTPKKSNKPSPDGQAKQQHKTCKKIAVEVLEQHVWKAAQDCRRVSSETIQLRYQVVGLGIDIIKREGRFDRVVCYRDAGRIIHTLSVEKLHEADAKHL